MDKNICKNKSVEFALRIVKLYNYLVDEKNEYVLSKQILRSGTSIGANIAEAECSFSKKEFLSKMYISFKECAETEYWLEILMKSNYISEKQYQSLLENCIELKKILSSITKTTRNQMITK